MARVLISAAHKSSGKTTVTVGLAAAMAGRGLTIQTFKKGPDYIDPMWLALASGRPCYNLDFNTQEHDEIRHLFARRAAGCDLALVEGNMGLYDGVDLEGSDSTAALARLLDAPAVLVVDAEGMTRGVAPLVLGLQAFDPQLRLAGVILNRVAGARQESKLRATLERYTDVPVLGALHRDARFQVVERHLGLMTPGEARDQHGKVAGLAQLVRDGVDLERIRAVAASAPPLGGALEGRNGVRPAHGPGDLVIAVARDEAFNFYYPDDLEAIEAAGAKLVYFSPLRDPELPAADGLLIGGGFPETHMHALERNGSLRAGIRAAAEAGLPIYAECGGLMYLSRSIAWKGKRAEMVGVVPADAMMHESPQGRGLVVLRDTGSGPWPGPGGGMRRSVPAHEFHYASLENIASGAAYAYEMVRGDGIDGRHDGIVVGNVLACFSHMRDTSRNRWAARFVSFVRTWKSRGSLGARGLPG